MIEKLDVVLPNYDLTLINEDSDVTFLVILWALH